MTLFCSISRALAKAGNVSDCHWLPVCTIQLPFLNSAMALSGSNW